MILSTTFSLYQRFSNFPLGKFFFSKAVAIKAPYFWTIHPLITDMRPGYCRVEIKDRRSIQNHFGTIHAGALCTLSELVGGLAVEASIAPSLRWIPREMSVQYIMKAKGSLVGECSFEPSLLQPGDMKLPLEVKDQSETIVLKAEIIFYISKRKP